ncbi:MAG TPA: response regulator [bacterium]|nr:response regulator [bacterium]
MTLADGPVFRVLIVENNEQDCVAVRKALQRGQSRWEIEECVRGEDALEQIRKKPFHYHVALIDHRLPGMSGLVLCKRLLAEGIPVPLAIITGDGSEELAVEALKAGVADYIIKDPGQGYLQQLPVVLQDVVRKRQDIAARRKMEIERDKVIRELKETLAKVKTLSGVLPICARCKKIRDENGEWTQIEVYIRDRSDVRFNHEICPDCARELYPEICKDEENAPAE